MVARVEGGVGVGGRYGNGQLHGRVQTAIFKVDNQQGPTVQHMELCLMLCGSLDGRGVWGKMDTCVCMAVFFHCSPEIITILLISCTPIENKMFKLKKLKRGKKLKVGLIFQKKRTKDWDKVNWGKATLDSGLTKEVFPFLCLDD